MTKVVQRLWEAIRFENALTLEPVFDSDRPIRSTGDLLPWYTGKACEHTKRSHINMCVYDSRWEANESLELDRNQDVRAWVKNDHIGFEITYSFKGIIHKFRPDYLVQLSNGKTLVLEVKGQDDQQQQTKREFLAEWVRAVNGHGGFGVWTADVSRHPKSRLAISNEVLQQTGNRGMKVNVSQGGSRFHSFFHLAMTRLLPDLDHQKTGRNVLIDFNAKRLADSKASRATKDERHPFFWPFIVP